jgi:hypothetical protein
VSHGGTRFRVNEIKELVGRIKGLVTNLGSADGAVGGVECVKRGFCPPYAFSGKGMLAWLCRRCSVPYEQCRNGDALHHDLSKRRY